MLVDQSDVWSLLRCPRTGKELRLSEGSGSLSSIGREDEESSQYRMVRGQPILVDFSNSLLVEDSLLNRNAESAVSRERRPFERVIKEGLLKLRLRKRVGKICEGFIEKLCRIKRDPIVLVIGGGSVGTGSEALYSSKEIRVVAFDIYQSSNCHFVGDAHRIPMASNSVDGVWIQYVLEHVLDPQQVVSEIHRVLKPGGMVYSETPFLQHVHEGAYDFCRFSHSGHRWLFRGFAEEDSGVSMGASLALLWSLERYITGVTRSRFLGKITRLALFWLEYLDFLVDEKHAYDSASSFYFVGRATEAPMRPREIVDYYFGAQ